MVLFLKDVHHGFPDFLDHGFPGFVVPADITEGFHLHLFVSLVAQADFHRKAVDAFYVPVVQLPLALLEGLALVRQIAQFLDEVRQPFEDSSEAGFPLLFFNVIAQVG
jgi:hypothetical protein